MSKAEHLIQVKQALADKYDRLAKLSGSRPRRARYKRHAESYRRQVQALQK
jgi:hypothetical protein